jgi:hypothetical protein
MYAQSVTDPDAFGLSKPSVSVVHPTKIGNWSFDPRASNGTKMAS